MIIFPDTQKKLRSRISSYKSSLNKEMKSNGYINDGSGKRYVLFWFYFVLNDLPQFEAYIEWYEREFPDDVGEPIQKLCWAIGLHRIEKEIDAKHMLAELMLSNLYIIPKLLGENIQEYDIWHSSNYEYLDYYEYISEEIISCIKRDDLNWIHGLYNSPPFLKMREKHIRIYNQLKHVTDFEQRRKLLQESYSIWDYLDEKAPPT